MKIVTLIENLVSTKDMLAEHGLSFYMEIDGKKILFDTGQTYNYALNALKMSIDISTIDYVIISHGHYDHTGGLGYFLSVNKTAKIYAKEEAFFPKYIGDQYIGIPHEISIPSDQLELIKSNNKLIEGLYILPKIELSHTIDEHKEGFYIKRGNEIVEDSFIDELFISIVNKDSQIIISSCSHNGITNIIETAEKYLQLPVKKVIGGFHCKNSNQKVIKHIIEHFNKNEIQSVGVCHCTGVEQYNIFKNELTADVYYNNTGSIMQIN